MTGDREDRYLLHAAGDLLPHCVQQNVEEEVVRLSRDVPLEREDLVVAALHDVLLQTNRVLDVHIVQFTGGLQPVNRSTI